MPDEQLIGSLYEKLPPCSPEKRQAVEEYLKYFLVKVARSLEATNALLQSNPTQELRGTKQYRQNQVATISWLLEVNRQRK